MLFDLLAIKFYYLINPFKGLSLQWLSPLIATTELYSLLTGYITVLALLFIYFSIQYF